MKKKLIAVAIASAFGLVGCGGGGGGSSSSEPTRVTATFVDSAVTGLHFSCDNNETGFTGEDGVDGEFTVDSGATCSFDISGFDIGSIAVTSDNTIITPYDTAANEGDAIKIASILQSIDSNGIAEDGISLTDFSGKYSDK